MDQIQKPIRMGYAPSPPRPLVDRSEQRQILEIWTQEDQHQPMIRPIVVLTGPGGIGKTTIAATIYEELAPDFALNLWISAHSLDSVIDAYYKAELTLSGDAHSTEIASTNSTREQLALQFLDRLRDHDSLESWLLVFDDTAPWASEPNNERWLPEASEHGHILIVTRSKIPNIEGKPNVRSLSISRIPISDALLFLQQAVPDERTVDPSTLTTLAYETQGHPLAMNTVATLLRSGDSSPEEILDQLVTPARSAQDMIYTGHPKEALDELKRLLDTQSKLLGPNHPDTLITRANIARIEAETGDIGNASKHFISVLDNQQRILGHDHTDTLATQGNFAQFMAEIGEIDTALSLFEQVLDSQQRLLGQSNPATLATLNNIASWKAVLGQLDEAQAIFTRVLEDQISILGPDHSDTITTQANIAQVLAKKGDVNTAADLTEQVISQQLRILGPDHPDTLTTLANFANLQGLGGNAPAAVRLLKENLQARQRTWGPKHPATLATQSALASWLAESGDLRTALNLFKQVLQDQQQILGNDHPDVRSTRQELAHWLSRAGDPVAALTVLANHPTSTEPRSAAARYGAGHES
ncbi:tetratricopeptide repeat protein [Tessaracoccus caeni]|uniref:tetratricopeptide repeat protein n=1 Tax=Tessaracoccus caeni TaxID=3031239 RepID=UPI0023DBCDED|nr:tetratricopeptide repeat protein [Tessaracoccus caeni]MDF1489420.1 tetratricopeptide repeat protein [Tessaracoccus caeni]